VTKSLELQDHILLGKPQLRRCGSIGHISTFMFTTSADHWQNGKNCKHKKQKFKAAELQLGAERRWSDLNCSTVEHAKCVLVWSLRRKLAAAIARANVDPPRASVLAN
jgi:hypothetical protein